MLPVTLQGWTVQHLRLPERAGLRELLDGVESERVVLAPGVALLFKNDRVLHGRDAFNGERWLQRAYFTDSIARFRGRAGSRGVVFDARDLIQG